MRPYFWPVVATTLASFGFAAYKFLVIGEQALAFHLDHWTWLPDTLRIALENCVKAGTVKDAIAQGLAAAITLGVILGYLINAPLAGAWRTSRLFILSGIGVGIGAVLTTPGVANVWLITVLVGIAYGGACAARGKVIPLLARQTSSSSTFSSGVINAVMVIGLLAGTVAGMGLFTLVKHAPTNAGHWWPHLTIAGIMLAVAFAGWRMRVPEPRPIPFTRGARDLMSGTGAMLIRHWAPLTGGGIAWGVASAASIGMLMFLVNELKIGETTAATIGAFSAIGAILGNLLSHRFAHRWQVGASYALMCAIIIVFPYLASGYFSAAVLAVLSGIAFAGGSNVLDAQFMADAHREGHAGRGATIMSLTHSLYIFIIGAGVALGLFLGWISVVQQFWLLAAFGFVALIAGLCTRLDAPGARPGSGH